MTVTAPEYVLARLENGAVKSYPLGHPVLDCEGVEILEDDHGPINGLDQHGDPLPTIYPHTADETLADDVATSEGYSALSVAKLKEEIDARNAAAAAVDPDADQISKGGAKADLVARLEAHDVAHAGDAVTETPKPDTATATIGGPDSTEV